MVLLDSYDGYPTEKNVGECSIAPSGQGDGQGLIQIGENFGESSIDGARHDTNETIAFEVACMKQIDNSVKVDKKLSVEDQLKRVFGIIPRQVHTIFL